MRRGALIGMIAAILGVSAIPAVSYSAPKKPHVLCGAEPSKCVTLVVVVYGEGGAEERPGEPPDRVREDTSLRISRARDQGHAARFNYLAAGARC